MVRTISYLDYEATTELANYITPPQPGYIAATIKPANQNYVGGAQYVASQTYVGAPKPPGYSVPKKPKLPAKNPVSYQNQNNYSMKNPYAGAPRPSQNNFQGQKAPGNNYAPTTQATSTTKTVYTTTKNNYAYPATLHCWKCSATTLDGCERNGIIEKCRTHEVSSF